MPSQTSDAARVECRQGSLKGLKMSKVDASISSAISPQEPPTIAKEGVQNPSGEAAPPTAHIKIDDAHTV